MAKAVQGTCPFCKKALRIPAEWAQAAMRCKFCRNTFQAKAKAGASTGGGGADPFDFEESVDGLDYEPSVAHRGRTGTVVLLMVFAFLSLGGFVTAGVLYRNLLQDRSGDARAEAYRAPEGDTNSTRPGNDTPVKEPRGNPTTGNPPTSNPTTGNPTKGPKNGPPKTAFTNTPFPRRALLISVNNYLMFNEVAYGVPRPKDKSAPGSSSSALRQQLSILPMNFPPDQVYELSDGAEHPHATQKAVIETTIKDYLESSRPQDRVVLFFSGHAVDIEKDSYLIPIEGVKDDAKTLIPLKWVYDQLAACKARQKIFIIDAFHYAPARGFELPGAGEGERGEMGEVFDANLQNPPPGVEVWSSCIKGQASIELDSGSAFVQALMRSMQERSVTSGIGSPGDSIPVQELVVRTNKKLFELLVPEKEEKNQISRLVGKEIDGGAPYNPAEARPAELAIKPPPMPPGGTASYAQIDRILDEIRLVPPVRESRKGEAKLLKSGNLPPFPAKSIEDFKNGDGKTVAELVAEAMKDKKVVDDLAAKSPVRAAVIEGVLALQHSSKVFLPEQVSSPITPQKKTEFLNAQRAPGKLIFELEQTLGRMKKLADKRDEEPSKRWQANFDYTMARLESRLVYLFEYSYMMGQIRSESLPTLEKGQNGWRIGARKKVQVSEPKIKQYAKEIGRTWKHIEDEYPGTPWAVLAKRENLIALGLEWRAKSE